ncbi:hypothetical protein [Paraferrimonas sp. SM1919]|uniref:hypothetical protein n=1 Tax=Paraferrimonas sp. SM1919 TaxID=2662263 RepID=UPI0013D42825|nr:hypothetical protein [Paraferrimonas sp. SM1919]
MSKKNLAVLVCYYPNYVADAITWISKILDKLALPFELVIVANNDKAYSAALSFQSQSIKVIKGTNNGWEFSAWDEGWDSIKDPSLFHKVIFVNDTFCQHWPFSWINVELISRAIDKQQNNQIIGDIKKFKNNEQLMGLQVKRWMASYLFSCNSKEIKKLLPFDKIPHYNWHSNITLTNKVIDLKDSSEGMVKHLQDYMFPTANKGWYNAGASEQLKRMKLYAIINEITLSAAAEAQGMQLISFHPYRWMRSLNRLRRRWHSIKQKN